MRNLKHILSARLPTAWAAAALLWSAPVLAGDADVRQAVHEALSAELPSVHTETHLPDAREPGREHHEEQREQKRKDGERQRDDRDRHEQKDHDGREGQEGRDRQEGHDEHGQIDTGDVGERGEVGEHGSGAGTMDEDHGRENEGHGDSTGQDQDPKD